MTSTSSDPAPRPEAASTLRLARWTVTSGSNAQSRGAVIIAAGDHDWEASAEGNGPIDALYRAVDRAIAEILDGHPRLLAYDIHALAEGPDAEGEVRVRIAPPSAAAGRRGTGRYTGVARSTNIVAASIQAYIDAVNQLLAEAHWAGAAESAGRSAKGSAAEVAGAERAELDEAAGTIDTTEWFNR